MVKFTNPLDRVRVAAPCSADWDQMFGSERARFCSQCNLNVYNLSGMTKSEAEALLTNTEGRLCVRFYRRADGTILTENCPVGLRALKRRVVRVANAALSAVLSFGAGVGLYGATSSWEEPVSVMGVIAPVEAEPFIRPVPPPQVEMGEMIMGRTVISVDDEVPHNKAMQPTRDKQASRKRRR